jgi:hypothetical protein
MRGVCCRWVNRRCLCVLAGRSHRVFFVLSGAQYSVYACNTLQYGASGSVFAARPSLNISSVCMHVVVYSWGSAGQGCCWSCAQVSGSDTTTLYYEPADVVTAWSLLLNASTCFPQLKLQATYLHDLVAIAAQVGDNCVVHWLTTCCEYLILGRGCRRLPLILHCINTRPRCRRMNQRIWRRLSPASTCLTRC